MISTERLKGWLNLEATTEHDDELRRLEVRAVAYLELRLGQHIQKRAEFTETLTAIGDAVLWVRNRIDELVRVELRDTFSGVWREQTLSDYEADGFALRKLQGSYPSTRGGTRVTYKSGFRSSEGPDPDIEQAVLELVETWFRQRVTATGGLVPRRGGEDQLPEEPRIVEEVVASRKVMPGL
jgi:hypothetical protein